MTNKDLNTSQSVKGVQGGQWIHPFQLVLQDVETEAILKLMVALMQHVGGRLQLKKNYWEGWNLS